MDEKLSMGIKERTRGKIPAMVVESQITLKQAALKMQVCYLQVKRIYKGYMEQGDKGLLHKGLGKPSKKDLMKILRKKAWNCMLKNIRILVLLRQQKNLKNLTG